MSALVGTRARLLGLIAIFIGLAIFALSEPPKPKIATERPLNITVRTSEIQADTFQLRLRSYGTVRPRTRSDLVAQVGGMITEINTQFRSGGFFTAGEVLLGIDPRDYEVALLSYKAQLADAKQALLLESARARQALEDWNSIGRTGTPSDLTLRKPQMASAQARLQSAQAAVARAELDLDRTRVKAPYAGRMLEQQVDLGEVVSTGQTLGTIYASDYMEVRLPLRNNDIAFINLPEPGGFGSSSQEELPVASFHSSLSQQSWSGKIVRTESALDELSHQLYVIAQIEDPYGLQTQGGKPPKIGEYVTATIMGRTINDAIVISNGAIYQNAFVYVVEEGVLRRRDIDILWQDDTQALIGSGLSPGDQLVLNRVGERSAGYPVITEGRVRSSSASGRQRSEQPAAADNSLRQP
jgi:RND family efflux transporter MFP subunit